MTCVGCGNPIEPSGPYDHRRKWCSERCRKRSYGDPCIDCGTRTGFGAEKARVPEPRCYPCWNEFRRHWTPERVVARIREWADRDGEPPAAPDWNPWHARHVIHDEERARRFEEADGYWPNQTTVFGVFDSWNAALEAAGYESRAPHGGDGNVQRRRDLQARAAA